MRVDVAPFLSGLGLSAILVAVMYNHFLPSPGGLNVVDILALVLPLIAALLLLSGSKVALPLHGQAGLLLLFVGGIYYIFLAGIFVFTDTLGRASVQILAANMRYFIAAVLVLCSVVFFQRLRNPVNFLMIAIFLLMIPHFIAAAQQGATVYLGIGSPSDWIYVPERREGVHLTWSVAGFADNQFTLAAIGLFVASFALAALFGTSNLTQNQRLIFFLLFAMGAICIILTARRVQTLALFAMLLVLFIYSIRKSSSPQKVLMSVVRFMLVGLVVFSVFAWLSQYTSRFNAFGAMLSGSDDPSLRTYDLRLAQIDIFLENITNNPFGTLAFPTGLGFFGGDLSFLSQWLWGGVPGALFYVLLHVAFAVSAYKVLSKSEKGSEDFAALFMLLIAVGFFVRALGSGGGLQVPSNFLYWVAVGCFLSFSAVKQKS